MRLRLLSTAGEAAGEGTAGGSGCTCLIVSGPAPGAACGHISPLAMRTPTTTPMTMPAAR